MRWKYIAFDNGRLVGSIDGATLSVVFDAQRGSWPGGGFFADFPATLLVDTQRQVLDTGESVIAASRSSSQQRCEYFPGYGSVCGGEESHDLTEVEYFREGVGPYGYTYSHSYSYSGGGFWSGGNKERAVRLVEYALDGTPPTIPSFSNVDEAEPNDRSSSAQLVNPPVLISGDAQVGDSGALYDFTFGNDTFELSLEDWYAFELSSPRSVKVTLDTDGGSFPSADFDVYLLNEATNTLLGYSNDGGTGDEEFTVDLSAGRYYVVVDNYNATARLQYTLRIE